MEYYLHETSRFSTCRFDFTVAYKYHIAIKRGHASFICSIGTQQSLCICVRVWNICSDENRSKLNLRSLDLHVQYLCAVNRTNAKLA